MEGRQAPVIPLWVLGPLCTDKSAVSQAEAYWKLRPSHADVLVRVLLHQVLGCI